MYIHRQTHTYRPDKQFWMMLNNRFLVAPSQQYRNWCSDYLSYVVHFQVLDPSRISTQSTKSPCLHAYIPLLYSMTLQKYNDTQYCMQLYLFWFSIVLISHESLCEFPLDCVITSASGIGWHCKSFHQKKSRFTFTTDLCE